MRDDAPERDQSDAAFWYNLYEILPQMMMAIRSSWLPPIDFEGDKRTEYLKWDALCKAQGEAVDNAVRLQISGKPAPILTDEQFFLLAARYDALYGFLIGFSWQQDGKLHTVFPKPTGTKEEVLCKLLIDWWWGPGIVLCFDYRWRSTAQ